MNLRKALAATALAVLSFGCAPSAVTSSSYVPAPALTQSTKTMLCDFTGGPAAPDRPKFAGRRYTPEERTRARGDVTAKLRELGLTAREHAYSMSPAQILNTQRYSRYPYLDGVNLYAELPPTVPGNDEWIVVGAHYDTVDDSPGADDNGSGVIAALRVAEAVLRMEHRKRGVAIVFFDQEEEGCIGSQNFVDALATLGKKVVVAHVIDMAGYDGDGDRRLMVGRAGNWRRGRAEDPLRDLYDQARRNINVFAPPHAPRISGLDHAHLDRSDHDSFVRSGIPSALLSEEFVGGDSTPWYHSPGDTCDTIDVGQIDAIAALVAEAVRIQLVDE